MFGYLRTRNKRLFQEDRELLKIYYCGVCNALRSDFGLPAAALTGWDSRFLALLVEAQIKGNLRNEETRCPASLWRKKRPIPKYGSASRYASAVVIFLLGEKLRDDIDDKSSKSARILRTLTEKKLNKSTHILRELEFPLSKAEELRKVQKKIEEMREGDNLYELTQPTANIGSMIFSHTAILAGEDKNLETLRRIGSHVGRLIAIIDACIDLPQDIQNENYNEILALQRGTKSKSGITLGHILTIEEFIFTQLKSIRPVTRELIFYRYNKLITNTLALGLFDVAIDAFENLKAFVSDSIDIRENSGECINCGNISSGHFCPQCGMYILQSKTEMKHEHYFSLSNL
jgi:hypothetical protein